MRATDVVVSRLKATEGIGGSAWLSTCPTTTFTTIRDVDFLKAVRLGDPVRRQMPALRRDRGRSPSAEGVSSSATSSGSASTGSHSCGAGGRIRKAV